MMRTILAKRAAALLTFLAVTVVSVVIIPLDAFAKEKSLLDQYAETCNELNAIGEVVDGTYFGDIEWYVRTYCEDGKWTPSYKNDYNDCFHAGNRYE